MADKYEIIDFQGDTGGVVDSYSLESWSSEVQQQVDLHTIPHRLENPSNLDRILLELMDSRGSIVGRSYTTLLNSPYVSFEEGALQVDTLGVVGRQFGELNGKYTLKVTGLRNYIFKGSEYKLDENTDQPTDELEPNPPVGTLTVIEKSRSGLELRVKAFADTEEAFETFWQSQKPTTMPDNTDSSIEEVIWPLNIRFGTNVAKDGTHLTGISHNWMYHAHTTKGVDSKEDELQDTLIIKLINPAPTTVQSGTKIEIRRELFVPYSIPVNIDISPIVNITYDQLRGPNLRLPQTERTGRPTDYKTFDNLTTSNTSVKSSILDKFVSGSDIIDTNLNYREYKDFVHFGSAEEKLKTFKYKLEKIQFFESKSSGVTTDLTGKSEAGASSSAYLLENKVKYNNAASDIISNFDDYEYNLYFNSSSTATLYLTDGPVNYNPFTWPKTSTTKPYTNLSVTSSAALTWYNAQIETASFYDQGNPSGLRNMIPTHIRVDDQSANWMLMYDMMGSYFDVFFNYIKMIENMNERNESLYEGLSKDLLFDVAKSLGWYLQSGYDGEDLWSFLLGTDDAGAYQASGSGETLTYVKKESYSKGDIEKQTWKRIINNIPMLLKTKGSSRGMRALLATYGIPSTILRVQEYGGPVSTKKGIRRAIEKFNYALNFHNVDSSDYIQFEHSALKNHPAYASIWPFSSVSPAQTYPSMYEWRIDTSHTASMHLFGSGETYNSESMDYETATSESAQRWNVYLEHSASAAGNDSPAAQAAGSSSLYCKYGRLVWTISGSGGFPATSASTDWAPFYNNDWWNISIGFSDFVESTPTDTNTMILRYAAMGEHADRILYSGSISTAVTKSVVENWANSQLVYLGGSGSAGLDWPGDINTAAFSGSMQEFRGWAKYISDDAFFQHTMAATSLVGDTITDAYNDMYFRIPMGTDFGDTHNGAPIHELSIVAGEKISTSGSVPSSHLRTTLPASLQSPNSFNTGHQYRFNGGWAETIAAGRTIFSPKSETYYVDVPFTAGPRPHNNKIRLEDNKLRNNQLSRNKSFEVSSYDSNPLDSHEIDIALSPADQIDTDIAMQFGAFSLADYIADPRDKYKEHYTSLRDTNNLYFKKFSGAYNVWEFIKVLNTMNKGMFKQIESMIPARADATVGIIIRPNLLERHKLNQPISMSYTTPFYTGTIQRFSGSYKPVFNGSSKHVGIRYESRPRGYQATTNLQAELNIGVRSSQQGASGSNTYIDRFNEGSEYLENVFGEVTRSFVQTFISSSAIQPTSSGFQFVPTFNIYNRPVPSTAPTSGSYTGSSAKCLSNLYPKLTDVNPNYLFSHAQRRLVIDGTKISSGDWNIGSTETIDGGPVAEYQLVNPNIVQVTPSRYGSSNLIGQDSQGNPVSLINRPSATAATSRLQNPNQNITVR